MTRGERRIVKQRVLAKEKLSQFYRSYKYHIDEALKFTDGELRKKLNEIESLFCIGHNLRTKEERKRYLRVPVTYETYQEFRKMSWQMNNWFNRALRQKLKAIREIHKDQSIINFVIFKMMAKNLSHYIEALSNNYHLKGLCKFAGEIGEYSKDFKVARLSEAKSLRKECKNLIALSKTEMFIENLDEHVRAYADFFVQCHFRLDKFKEKVNMMLKDQREMDHKTIEIPDPKSEKISLELPG